MIRGTVRTVGLLNEEEEVRTAAETASRTVSSTALPHKMTQWTSFVEVEGHSVYRRAKRRASLLLCHFFVTKSFFDIL